MGTIIDVTYNDGNMLLQYLLEQKEITLYQNAEANFKKTILLSVASYFEAEIKKLLLGCVESHTKNDVLIISMIKQKIIDRDYHQLFDWDKPNANKFFSLFGHEFKSLMEKEIKSDSELSGAIKAFLEIGQKRNTVAHNFATILIDDTVTDIYEKYQSALYFVETLNNKLIYSGENLDA